MAKGHTHAVDYWSYGVLMYEMLCGRSPFSRPNQSHMEMFKRIVLVKYNFPMFMDRKGEDLIQKLLVRHVTSRLGGQKNGFLDIRKHDFFQENGIDAKQLLRRKIPAPWIPQVQDPLDAQEFYDFDMIENDPHPGPALNAQEQALFECF
jgi:serine/threonine protein kinase